MAEIRRGRAGEGGNDRLPWLEPVDEEIEEDTSSRGLGRLAGLGLGLLVLIGIAVAAIVLFQRWSASRADIGELIRAPTGPYKERPANPGGLKVDASGIIAEKTGTGADIDAPLDLAAIPEQPITGPGSERGAPAPLPVASPRAALPTPAAPKPVVVPPPAPVAAPPPAEVAVPVPATGGGTIQLGAFSTEAKAKSVWKTMSSRFAYLAPMTMTIAPVKSGDKTLYRLRASGAPAAATCAKLRVAGETCAVAD